MGRGIPLHIPLVLKTAENLGFLVSASLLYPLMCVGQESLKSAAYRSVRFPLFVTQSLVERELPAFKMPGEKLRTNLYRHEAPLKTGVEIRRIGQDKSRPDRGRNHFHSAPSIMIADLNTPTILRDGQSQSSKDKQYATATRSSFGHPIRLRSFFAVSGILTDIELSGRKRIRMSWAQHRQIRRPRAQLVFRDKSPEWKAQCLIACAALI